MTSSKMSITAQSPHWFDGMWHLSLQPHAGVTDTIWCEMGAPCEPPALEQGFERLLILLRKDFSTHSPSSSLCQNQQQGNLKELSVRLFISMHNIYRERENGPKTPHLLCSALSTHLSIRAGGPQKKEFGEFGKSPSLHPHSQHYQNKEEWLGQHCSHEPSPAPATPLSTYNSTKCRDR